MFCRALASKEESFGIRFTVTCLFQTLSLLTARRQTIQDLVQFNRDSQQNRVFL